MFPFCRCEDAAPESVAPLEVYGRPTLDDSPADGHPGRCSEDRHENFVQLPASFEVNETAPLREPPVISAPLWFLQCPDQERTLQRVSKVMLSIYVNGIRIRYLQDNRPERSLAWSPFAVVQACRFFRTETDDNLSQLRLFKVADFHHGVSCLFAAPGLATRFWD
eukprot:s1780_g17.t1